MQNAIKCKLEFLFIYVACIILPEIGVKSSENSPKYQNSGIICVI